MIIKEDKNNYVERLSWSEFVAQAKNEVKPSASTNNSDFSFTGVHSHNEALDLAENGWREGAEKIASISKKYVDVIAQKIERIEYHYDTEGTSFDIGVMMSGQPEYWLNPQITHVESESNHLIRILVNGSANASVSAADKMKRGSIIAALVDTLEVAGKSVELLMCFPTENGTTNVCLIVEIKSFDQRLDADKIAFALAHPAAHRQLKFRWIEQTTFGYGSAEEYSLEDKKDYDLYLPVITSYFSSGSHSMEQWIEEHLYKLGVRFKD